MQSGSSHSAYTSDLPSIDELSRDRPSERHTVLSVAAIDFPKLIEAAGAQDVVAAMAAHFNISDEQLHSIVDRSSPFLLRAYEAWMARRGGIQQLNELVYSGGPQQFADRPGLVAASLTRQEGQALLARLFPEYGAVDVVTTEIAATQQIRLQKVQELMPHLAALFVGVLCKSIAK